MKSTNVEVSQRDLPMANDNLKEIEQITLERGTTLMGAGDMGPSEDPIKVAMSRWTECHLPQNK